VGVSHISNRSEQQSRRGVLTVLGAVPAAVLTGCGGSADASEGGAALPVWASTSRSSYGPVFPSNSLPKPTHLPAIRRPVGSTSICSAPKYR